MQLPNRLTLIQTLSGLPAAQFNQLVFTLDPPKGILPLESAQGKVASVLLDWVETTGPGLVALEQMLNEVLGIESPPQTAICPYKGLSYFDCNDADYHYFYGREALTQTLLDKVAQDNFLAIVGASGSGKSSVLRAGLLQRLKDQGGTEIRILVPGEHPLQSLGLAFVDEALERTDRAKQLQNVEDLMQQGAKGLGSLVKTSPAERVVLVVDQFEEAFTLCNDTADRQAFFATLLGGLKAAPGRLCLIVAMRSDFVGKCFEQHYSGLAQQVERHLTAVLPMTPAELTEAIATPARQTGLSLEPGLVEALLKDVDPASGSLPLLQYTLTELWQRQQDNQLKLSTYHQLGGVTGTLRQRADAVYDALSPEQQQTARHIFLSLTQLGEGAEDTRRRIAQDSLVSAQHPEPQVAAVVKRLADANLVMTDERAMGTQGQRTATVDVAHEALIRNWPRLRQWLDENRDLLRQQRKIELAAAEWDEQNRQKRYLLEGRQLSDAQAFRKKHREGFPLSNRADTLIQESIWRRLWSWATFSSVLIIPFTLTYFVVEPAIREGHIREARSQIDQKGVRTRESVEYFVRGCSVQRGWGNRLPSWLLQPIFGNCISLYGHDLSDADLSFAKLSHAPLRDRNFQNTNLGSANLEYADLSSSNLRNSNLGYANLEYAYLSNSNFHNANLEHADLGHSDLSSVNFTGANMINANFHGAILHDADLSGVDLRGSYFHSSRLSSADLSRTNLRGAYLMYAYLLNVNLRDADFSGAVLENAIFLGTDLRKTQGLADKQFIAGESSPLICHSPLPMKIHIEGGKDRDCDKLPAVLRERSPNRFQTIEEAEIYVEWQREKVWE